MASTPVTEEEANFRNFLELLTDLELEECLRLIMPIIKLKPGIPRSYLIGTKIKQVIIKNKRLIVRVGGGFMDLNKAIAIDAKIECL